MADNAVSPGTLVSVEIVERTRTEVSGASVGDNKKDGGVAAGVPPVSGSLSLAVQTMKDAWTYCKATKKTVARYQWVPALGAFAAVVSAITATTIFANITSNNASAAARIAVAVVAVVSAAAGALQTWVSTRVKDLNSQQGKFHELHRQIEAVLDDQTGPPAKDTVETWEKSLADVMAGMSEPSNRAWEKARTDVASDLQLTGVWRRHYASRMSLP